MENCESEAEQFVLHHHERNSRKMSLKEDLLAYQPFNEQEEKDREVMLALLDTQPDIFERKNRVGTFHRLRLAGESGP